MRMHVYTPAASQALSLSCDGEQLCIEEIFPEPAVEKMIIAVLQRGASLEVGGSGAAVFAPALQSVGNELLRLCSCGCIPELSSGW